MPGMSCYTGIWHEEPEVLSPWIRTGPAVRKRGSRRLPGAVIPRPVEAYRILRPEKIPGNPRGICGTTEKNLKKATFAGGCFLCMQPPFHLVEGVVGSVAGYTGGPLPVLTSGIRVAREYLVCSFSGRDNTT
jgi:hypothetical protein